MSWANLFPFADAVFRFVFGNHFFPFTSQEFTILSHKTHCFWLECYKMCKSSSDVNSFAKYNASNISFLFSSPVISLHYLICVELNLKFYFFAFSCSVLPRQDDTNPSHQQVSAARQQEEAIAR